MLRNVNRGHTNLTGYNENAQKQVFKNMSSSTKYIFIGILCHFGKNSYR